MEKLKVFLGGTCADSTWREELDQIIDHDKISTFNPVVPNWTPECQKEEDMHRETDDICVYTITPEGEGFYSFVEVTDDSNKRPEKTVLCVLKEANGKKFEGHNLKCVLKTMKLVGENGVIVVESLEELAACLNKIAMKKKEKEVKLLRKQYELTLEQVVELLLDYKAKGESVCYDFNGHLLYSDTVTMDSAFLEVTGKTKAEHEQAKKDFISAFRKEEEEKKKREARYLEKVMKSNHSEPREITMDLVIEGLKFIAENRSISQEELVDGLIEIGCDFTLDDVRRVIETHPEEDISLYKGIKRGYLSAGAAIIVNVRDSEDKRDFADDRLLSADNDESIYAYIRKVTNDPEYTQDNLRKVKVKKLEDKIS